jgi:hypothetical protein
MLDIALPALILVLLGLAWHSALGAREIAREHARHLCRRARLQLLDETVALEALRPQRDHDGHWQLARRYAFDVSSDGHDRLRASLRMLGNELAGYSLPLEAEGPREGGTVVRFPGAQD